MSVVISAPPEFLRVHRAPLLDPPFEDELCPAIYRPLVLDPRPARVDTGPAPASSECYTASLRFLNVCLELFNGFRSPRQMVPLLHVQRAHAVLDELSTTARQLNERRRLHGGSRVRRCQLRTCEPRTGAVEVAAVLTDGVGSWAMCYRLEGSSGTWRCTFLRVILPTATAPKRR